MINTLIRLVKKHIKNGDLQVALEELYMFFDANSELASRSIKMGQLSDQIILLNGRFSNIQKERVLGNITASEREIDRLRSDVLILLNDLEEAQSDVDFNSLDSGLVTSGETTSVVERTKTTMGEVEITISKDFEKFSDEDILEVLSAIKSLLKIGVDEIRLKNKDKGSVKLRLELPNHKIDELLELIELGYLNEYQIEQAIRFYSKRVSYSPALLGENIKIGINTIIQPGSYIYSNVSIGDDCEIGSGSVIRADINGLEYWDKNSKSETINQIVIGNNVHIEPQVTIRGSVQIGDGCWIGSGAVIHDGARIGNNCKIFPGAVISSIPQDKKFHGERTTMEIGENTVIREFVSLNRGTVYSGATKIGKNGLIMAYVHIAHDCIIGDNVIITNAVNIGGHVEIGDHVVIGGMSGFHQFVKVGKHAMIAGGSLVRKDVPPFIKVGREPLQYDGVNSIGLRRRGFSAEIISQISDIYRNIFSLKGDIKYTLDYIEENFPQTIERDNIVTFIRNAERGIVGRFKRN